MKKIIVNLIIITIFFLNFSITTFAKTANIPNIKLTLGFDRDDSDEVISSHIYYDNDIQNPVDAKGLKLLMINGNFIKNAKVFINNGTSIVPLRVVSESLGASVTWNENTKTAEIIKNGIKISVNTKSQIIKVNGKVISTGDYVKIIGNELYIPLRVIAENLNCNVGYNDDMLDRVGHDGPISDSSNENIPIIWVEDNFDNPKVKTKEEIKVMLKEFFYKEINSGYILDIIEREKLVDGTSETYNELSGIIDSINVIDGFGRFYFVETQRYYDNEYHTVKGVGSFIFIDKYYGTIFEIQNLSSIGEWEIFSGEECDPLMYFFVG